MVRGIFKSAMHCLVLSLLVSRQFARSSFTLWPSLNESGKSSSTADSTPYLIRHLPVSSFPSCRPPSRIALNRRGCLIPQTYEAHQPENVVHASLEHAARPTGPSSVLSMATVSLLVFFASNRRRPGGARLRAGDRAPAVSRSQATSSDSTGASTRLARSRFTKRKSACAIRLPRSTTMLSPTPSSTGAPSTIFMHTTPGRCSILKIDIASGASAGALDLCLSRHLAMSQRFG